MESVEREPLAMYRMLLGSARRLLLAFLAAHSVQCQYTYDTHNRERRGTLYWLGHIAAKKWQMLRNKLPVLHTRHEAVRMHADTNLTALS